MEVEIFQDILGRGSNQHFLAIRGYLFYRTATLVKEMLELTKTMRGGFFVRRSAVVERSMSYAALSI